MFKWKILLSTPFLLCMISVASGLIGLVIVLKCFALPLVQYDLTYGQ